MNDQTESVARSVECPERVGRGSHRWSPLTSLVWPYLVCDIFVHPFPGYHIFIDRPVGNKVLKTSGALRFQT